jgi:hypothetical protein
MAFVNRSFSMEDDLITKSIESRFFSFLGRMNISVVSKVTCENDRTLYEQTS